MFQVQCVIQGALSKNVSLGNLLQRRLRSHCLEVEACHALSKSLGLNRPSDWLRKLNTELEGLAFIQLKWLLYVAVGWGSVACKGVQQLSQS